MDNIACGTKGAAKEMAVAARFMMLGYEAFLNCAPHGVDLIVMDTEGVLSKVEVKSLQEYDTLVSSRGSAKVGDTQVGTFDILIAVNNDLEMWAHPHLPHFKELYPTPTEGNYTTAPPVSPVEGHTGTLHPILAGKYC